MPPTYDLNTPTGKVRLMIPDRDLTGVIFQDDEIDAFLVLEDADLKRATALALETIAADEALVQKVVKLQHLETNGAKTAEVLLKRAQALRDQAEAANDDPEDGEGLFDIAEMVFDPFSARERIWNQRQRYDY